jgi:KaiC/GvpD/RAD55 family RecA-like ATPase
VTLTLEQQLLKVLLNLEGWRAYREYVDSKDLEVNMAKLVKCTDKLYEAGAETILQEDLTLILKTEYPNIKDDQLRLCQILMDKVYKIDPDTVIFKEVMSNYKNKMMSSKLGEFALKSMDSPDKFNVQHLKDLISLYELDKIEEDDGSLREYTLKELLSSEDPSIGYSWFTPELTAMCGRMKGASLSLIIATPDTGKSAFCHSASTHFAFNGARVLHINNEERDKKVAMRARSCFTKMEIEEAMFNEVESDRRWDMLEGRWIFRDKSGVSIPDIIRYIKLDNPDIIFIDQATKIAIKEGGRHDLTLTDIFKALRDVAKEYDVDIIGVSQADASAYNTEYIKMQQVANSNIGIQGELDTHIGLTRPQESPFVNVSIPKGKESTVDSTTTQLELKKRISRMFPLEG